MRSNAFSKLRKVRQEDRQSFLGEAGLQLPERSFSEETAREIDCAVRGIVGAAFARTVALLTERREVLETAAAELLQKETLTEPDLQRLREALKVYANPGAHPASEPVQFVVGTGETEGVSNPPGKQPLPP